MNLRKGELNGGKKRSHDTCDKERFTADSLGHLKKRSVAAIRPRFHRPRRTAEQL